MHDPKWVAFEIPNIFVKKSKSGYRPSIITIWHVDPETDGTDDSCGSFIRPRHIDKKLVEEVVRDFEFNFKHDYWFNAGGYPVFSVMGTTLEMYSTAAWKVFMHLNNNKPDRKSHRKFMNKFLYEILHFAENPTDSLHSSITMKFGVEKKDERCRHFATIILADIMRKLRPWYKAPKWHIHHWEIQFHPWQQFKRKYFDKCCKCGKRGVFGPAYSDWNGTKIWCEKCNGSTQVPCMTAVN